MSTAGIASAIPRCSSTSANVIFFSSLSNAARSAISPSRLPTPHARKIVLTQGIARRCCNGKILSPCVWYSFRISPGFFPAAKAHATIAPVLVPTRRLKHRPASSDSVAGFSRASRASTASMYVAWYTPRIPPPSKQSTLKGFFVLISIFYSVYRKNCNPCVSVVRHRSAAGFDGPLSRVHVRSKPEGIS